ncbi:MAG TPA: tape measure protein [Microbacterium sp.]|uniref:tape measure protein n=1 Tax=Microbacterium sp. TaxID=51671 RepID=UPI002B45F0F9|nr:tape measure protein [Microbacterium sp.]HKT56112.1 tape measure protein [Microbacterium sp.]
MSGGGKLGTAYYELIPSMRGAQQQITSALAPAASGAGAVAGRGFSLKFAAIAGGVGGIAAAVAGRAASAITGFISEAAQASDATDKFRQTLAFAGLGSTAIDGLTKSTRRYADQTVYSLADIQGITAQLAANGVKGYGSLAEAAGNLNAVAGGNAETFKSVGLVLTQTAGAGKLITGNWNQLANAIPGASGKLQQALKSAGAYTGNFQEAMAKGQISADEFNAAILKLGFTDVAKKAATSTSTIEGALGNLQASIVGVLSDGISKVKPAITGVINFAATGVTAIGSLFGRISGVIQRILHATLAPVGAAVKQSFGGIAEKVGPIFAAMGPAIAQILPPLLQLSGLFNPVSLIFHALLPVLPQVTGLLGTLAATLGSALLSVLQQVAPILSQLATILTGVMNQAVAALLPVVVQLVGVFTQLVPAVMPLVGVLLQLIGPIISLIAPLLQLIGPILQPLIGLFVAILKPILALIQPIIGLLVPVLKIVATVLQVVITWVAQAITWFVKLVTGNKQAGQQFLAVWNGLMSFFSGIGQWFAGVWNGLINGISSFIGKVVGFFTSLPGKIGDAFAGAGRWLWDAGVNIVQGLIGGIQSLAGSIGRWFLSVIPDWIKAPFMAALGIHSPSTVFHELGEFTMQGFINGVSSKQREVQDTVTQVANLTASAGMSGSGSTFGVAARGDTYNFNGITTDAAASEISEKIETTKRRRVYATGATVLAGVS